ncbi:MAG TPA: mannose-1-phosphate guanylyltransferase/mannose-6-phosphate isomerase [Gammaproteobacteria bacterium]|nr:mannose-1-phosphate guanylyltransferase/mannose-6-phosphate isomerase [Gammaproteobacteria bacterium]
MKSGHQSVIPVIISGGAGSRLWPLSREAHPKPFIKLADDQSLLQKTFIRAGLAPHIEEILTVTNREVFFHTRDEYRAINPYIKTSYILEPIGRNTAPAVAAAALYLLNTYDKNSILLVLPADHLIHDQENFSHAVKQAIQLAEKDYLVTFGMRPTLPETGYGYLEIDGSKELLKSSFKDIFTYRVLRFVEKPNADLARQYLDSGNHFWNSGMFCFSIETLLNEMNQHAPELLESVKESIAISQKMQKSNNYFELESESFARVPDISIDYALMEKSNHVAAVACDIGWNDIGSWNALSELTEADASGNRIVGEGILHDTTNCYIHGSDRVIGTVGLDNLVIVDMPDALLVSDRNRAQEVKYIVQRLKHLGNEVVKLHREVHRPWGSYTVIDEGENFKMKRIKVKPGASLSLQMHYHRSEHWIVVSGTALVVNGDQQFIVNANESTFIPAGHQHRLENPGKIDLVIVEVQSGAYLGEDDIVRFEDKYGRVPA